MSLLIKLALRNLRRNLRRTIITLLAIAVGLVVMLLGLSLGIINLVPIPVLDGGQLVFYLLEWIRGRPLSVRIREFTLQIGVIFLVLLMLVVLFFDISRLIGG